MMIEGLRPLCLVFPDCRVHLVPGHPMYFTDYQASRVLAKAAGKVRVVRHDYVQAEFVEGETLVWKSESGMCGPAIVHVVDNGSEGRWLLVVYDGNPKWLRETIVFPLGHL